MAIPISVQNPAKEPMPPPTFLKLPSKFMKRLFTYLSPIDCFNLAQVNPDALNLVRKRSNLELSALYLRFDNEKSCIGAYFEKRKYTGYVFYSWRTSTKHRITWTNTYPLKPHKLATYMFVNRTHPKVVQALQPTTPTTIDYIAGMVETYMDLLSMFPKNTPYTQMGFNVTDKLTCQAFGGLNIRHVQSIRLFGEKEASVKRIREVLQPITSYDSVRIGWKVGKECLQRKVINSPSLHLDDPEWLTREHLLNLNCLNIDIGHNHLTPDDLNAFLMQWMFESYSPVRCERLEINLSPEAFNNKRAILENLPVMDWDPRIREGEHFDVSRYIYRSRIRDPHHFLDCKQGKDLIHPDGRLATINFHGKKMYFIVWNDRFPYSTLKRARRQVMEEKAKANLIRALRAAVAVLMMKEEIEWRQRLDAFEEQYNAHKAVEASRKIMESEERSAKRKYYEALTEFMDTSAPKRKRRLLRTITIFK